MKEENSSEEKTQAVGEMIIVMWIILAELQQP